MAPFRLHTRGYTGAKRTNQRESYVYSDEEIAANIKRVNEIIASDFTVLNAYDFTQYARGQLFALIDSSLVSHFDSKSCLKDPKNEVKNEDKNEAKKEAKIIFELCETFIKLCCAWLKKLPTIWNSVISF